MQEIIKTYNKDTLTETQTDRELLAFFFEQIDASEKTIQTYKRNIKPYILHLRTHGETVTSATYATVNAYKRELTTKQYKATTINAYLSAVRALYKTLESNGKKANIAANIKNARINQKSSKNALTIEQTRLLLKEPKEGASIKALRDYALINLAVRRGLRTVEIMRANIEDIQQTQGHSVLLVQGKGHAQKDDIILLSGEILEPITRYLTARGINPETDSNAPLFASTSNNNAGGRMTTRAISQTIKSAMQAQGINEKTLTAHSLRHTAVTLALLSGATLQETQAMARHSNINTTLIYAHNLDRLKGGAENAIDAALCK